MFLRGASVPREPATLPTMYLLHRLVRLSGDPGNHAFSRHSAAAFLWMGLIVLLPGCAILQAPNKMVNAVMTGPSSGDADLVNLHLRIQRFSDEFALQPTEAREG